jgi:hypothetical protein
MSDLTTNKANEDGRQEWYSAAYFSVIALVND